MEPCTSPDAQPRVLLVDDEERFLQTLSKRLKRRNIDVASVNRGLDALQAIQDRCTDVVVLDVKMPGVGGLEMLAEIKKLQPDIEVILLTGHTSIDVATEGLRMGAFEYLMKPCDLDVLVDTIRSAHALRMGRLEKARQQQEEQE